MNFIQKFFLVDMLFEKNVILQKHDQKWVGIRAFEMPECQA